MLLNDSQFDRIEAGRLLIPGEPRSTRCLSGSQCMTPPLILGNRAAEEMLERRSCGVPVCFVATMTMLGVSSPITRWGSVVAGAAEILGGMVAAHAVCPEGRITGGAFVVSADMKGGSRTRSARPATSRGSASLAESSTTTTPRCRAGPWSRPTSSREFPVSR